MQTHTHRGIRRGLVLGIVVIGLLAYASWALLRPMPAIQPDNSLSQHRTSAPAAPLAWPASGQAAVGIIDSAISENTGSQTPVPTASTAKIITALVVLDKKPLKAGEAGPVITLTPADVALYEGYKAVDGSLLPVVAGEQLSEYQMLQAIMLPSANNIADSLAIWAFGSLPTYSTAANEWLAAHKLTNTHVGTDASGLSPTTTSTAIDLVALGTLAIKQPALAAVVAQKTATGIPVVSTISNVNSLLGTDNIIGIKTGNSDEAGGVFVSASRIPVNGKAVTIVTAVAASANLYSALSTSRTLVRSAQAHFAPLQIVKKGQTVGSYTAPWGVRTNAVAAQDMTQIMWQGGVVQSRIQLETIPSAKEHNKVGVVTVAESAITGKRSVDIKLSSELAGPSVFWRLGHPF